MKGTQLETLDHEYNLTEEKLQMNAVRMDEQKDAARHSLEGLKEKQRKFEAAKQQQTLEDRFNKYSRQMAWVQVEEEEVALRRLEEEIGQLDQSIQERTTEAEQASAKLEEVERQAEAANTAFDEACAELQAKEEEKAPISDKFNDGKRELQNLRADQRRIASQVDAYRVSIAKNRDQIEQERTRLAAVDNGAHARKMNEIQEAKAALTATRSRHQTLRAETPSLIATKKQAEQAAERTNRELQDRQDAVKDKENLIKNLEKGSRDWMGDFPKNLRNLISLIAKENRFREKPVGPLGRHIQLLQPKWSSILEASFGGRLNGFAVTNAEDKTVLLELMRKAS